MKILIAPDSFKESISAIDASNAIAKGIQKSFSEASCELVPLSDGGEGFLDCIATCSNSKRKRFKVRNPLGEKIEAEILYDANTKTAIIEMALASGLQLIPKEKRNAVAASSYGTGELISEALTLGAKTIILGIGGSATTDGGVGAFEALGVKFKDKSGKTLAFKDLAQLESIDTTELNPLLKDTKILFATDVTNPLLGDKGTVAVYAPQKGATKEDLSLLENNLVVLSDILAKKTGRDLKELPGAGAAGGIAFGLMHFAQAKIEPGFDVISDLLGLKDKIKSSDYVITGEGEINTQTCYGKLLMRLSELSSDLHKPLIALCGRQGEGYETLYEHGATMIFSITRGIHTTEYSMSHASELLESSGFSIGKFLKILEKK